MSRMSLPKLFVWGGMVIFLAGCAAAPHPAAAPQAAVYQSPSQTPPAVAGGVVMTSGTEVIAATPGYPPPGQPAYPAATPGGYPPAAAPGMYAPGMAPPSGPTLVAPGNAPAAGPVGPMTPVPLNPVVVAPVPPTEAKPKADEDAGFEWSDLAPEVVWKKLEKSMGYGPDEKLARQAFQEGQALFRAKKYAEAAPKFYIATWRCPDSDVLLGENAQFLLGESYFFDDQYGKAQDAYDNLLKSHGNTRYLDTVMVREFAIARYWELLDQAHPHWPVTPNFNDKQQPWFDTWGNALVAYQQIRLHDPTGPLADSAVMASANMEFRAGHYEDAANDYDTLRKHYPKSKFQMRAHILGLKSKMLCYQGPTYEVKPLKDATEIANQTLTQFRGKLGDEERLVRETRDRIEVLKAEREWTMGQYYDQKKYYGSARKYYQLILAKYAQTPSAEKARLRLEQIRNLPEAPANHLKWLTQVFDHER
jgi:outer membrane protein assembly factor BamD (BamD/ComL family)